MFSGLFSIRISVYLTYLNQYSFLNLVLDGADWFAKWGNYFASSGTITGLNHA